MTAPRWLGVVALAGAACRPSQPAPPPPWRLVHRGASAIVSVDTSRIVVRRGEYEVRLRIDYASSEPLPWDAARRYRRVDLATRVNCEEQVARDRTMDLLDSAGVRVDGVMAPGSARPFPEHPIGAWAFPPLCEFLADFHSNR